MKKTTLFFLLGGIIFLASCSKNEDVNLTTGMTPVAAVDSAHMKILDALVGVPDDQKMVFINKHWPTLEKDAPVVAKNYGYLPQGAHVDSVALFFGSGQGKANDKFMETHKGYFKNELIAALYVHGTKDPIYFFVKCTNGLMEPVDHNLIRIGSTSDLVFIIQQGQGLCSHVDYKTSILLARAFGLNLFTEKNRAQNITYDQALALENETDQIQVTVDVYEGDRFDLNTMTLTRKGKETAAIIK